MGRVTKWIGIGFLGLIGLLHVAVVIVYALTSRRMSKTYTRFMTDDEIHALWLYVHSVPPKTARGR